MCYYYKREILEDEESNEDVEVKKDIPRHLEDVCDHLPGYCTALLSSYLVTPECNTAPQIYHFILH